jgi:hypothetical protein
MEINARIMMASPARRHNLLAAPDCAMEGCAASSIIPPLVFACDFYAALRIAPLRQTYHTMLRNCDKAISSTGKFTGGHQFIA